MYIERVPDTVQTDHFDWGFRVSGLYGLDYRYTTSKGIFSNQLLGENAKYGGDPVMVYADLYFPKVADGMNVRIGRYVSLPDIEAQLAPNNYTYSHSLTYTYDCYTQSGINITTKLSDHWMIQTGLSGGCDAALWTQDAKATGTLCLSYTFSKGGDNIYGCANSINSAKYAYNNLAAYYLTWYHKINAKWHFDTEVWYQYEKNVPEHIWHCSDRKRRERRMVRARASRRASRPSGPSPTMWKGSSARRTRCPSAPNSSTTSKGSARDQDALQRASGVLEPLDRNQPCLPPGGSFRAILRQSGVRLSN